MNKALLSHKRDDWKTPKKIYDEFTRRLGFHDPCPPNPKEDGLTAEWKFKNFVNPPYSQIKKWVDKAIEEHKKGKIVILLLPSRTDTQWFKKLYEYGAIFHFQVGRLKFDDKNQNAPFPSVFITLLGAGNSYMRLTKNKLEYN